MSLELLTIKTVSRLTGISSHTLRAWERRYGAVKPSRSPSGQRSYSMEDVERLRLLKSLVDKDFTISQIADLAQEDLVQLATKEAAMTNQLAPSSTVTPQLAVVGQELPPSGIQLSPGMNSNIVQTILNCLQDYKLPELNELLTRAKFTHGARDFALMVCGPLMRKVGQMVAVGEMDVSQEHALSALMRNQIAQVIQSLQFNPLALKPSFAFATIENDLHEFGILISHVLTLSQGLHTNYLGANLPATSLVSASRALGATHIVIGSAKLFPDWESNPLKSYLDTLDANLPSGTEVWIGGRSPVPTEDYKMGIRTFSGFEEFDRTIQELAERTPATRLGSPALQNF